VKGRGLLPGNPLSCVFKKLKQIKEKKMSVFNDIHIEIIDQEKRAKEASDTFYRGENMDDSKKTRDTAEKFGVGKLTIESCSSEVLIGLLPLLQHAQGNMHEVCELKVSFVVLDEGANVPF
jgi:hypothetical protein